MLERALHFCGDMNPARLHGPKPYFRRRDGLWVCAGRSGFATADTWREAKAIWLRACNARMGRGSFITSEPPEPISPVRQPTWAERMSRLEAAQLQEVAQRKADAQQAMMSSLYGWASTYPSQATQLQNACQQAPAGLANAFVHAPYVETKPEKKGWKTGEELYEEIFPGQDWRLLPPRVRALYDKWAE